MKPTLSRALLALAALGAFWGAGAAEAVKLRVLSSIYADGAGAALKNPEGVATDGKSRLAVADTGNGRVVLYALAPDTVSARSVFQLPEVPQPVRVQFDGQGNLLLLDGQLHRVARVSAEGVFSGYLEIQGSKGTVVPTALKTGPEGRIFLLDQAGARVLVVNAQGQVQRELPFPAGRGFPTDLAVGPKGAVYLLDAVLRRLFSFPAGGGEAQPLGPAFVEEADFPASLAADERGRLFLADMNGGGILIAGADGTFRGRQSGMGWKEGLLRYPADLCLDGQGRLFVADRGNNRVQVFSLAN